MSDQKEIRRYYDFSHLLKPAPKLSTSELNYYYTLIGPNKARRLTIDCFFAAICISDAISYARLGPGATQFNPTTKAIDEAVVNLAKADDAKLNMLMLDQFIHSPECSKIFNYIVFHEIDMARRNTFNEPLRGNS